MMYYYSMDPKQLYIYALDVAGIVARKVEPEQFTLPTPDTDWNVHDLLQHIVYELAWMADIVQGRTIAEVGDKYDGELLHGDPAEVWATYEATTRAAVEACDPAATAHLSYADKTVGDYLLEAGNDQLVHAWDLGQAIGVDVRFDEAVARDFYERALARKDELAGSGLFGRPVEVSDTADIQTKLLALLGRSEDWAHI